MCGSVVLGVELLAQGPESLPGNLRRGIGCLVLSEEACKVCFNFDSFDVFLCVLDR